MIRAEPNPNNVAVGALMTVQVPEGLGPGSVFPVDVPGRGACRVTVPPGAGNRLHCEFYVNWNFTTLERRLEAPRPRLLLALQIGHNLPPLMRRLAVVVPQRVHDPPFEVREVRS